MPDRGQSGKPMRRFDANAHLPHPETRRAFHQFQQGITLRAALAGRTGEGGVIEARWRDLPLAHQASRTRRWPVSLAVSAEVGRGGQPSVRHELPNLPSMTQVSWTVKETGAIGIGGSGVRQTRAFPRSNALQWPRLARRHSYGTRKANMASRAGSHAVVVYIKGKRRSKSCQHRLAHGSGHGIGHVTGRPAPGEKTVGA